jgi:hypothetical protein
MPFLSHHILRPHLVATGDDVSGHSVARIGGRRDRDCRQGRASVAPLRRMPSERPSEPAEEEGVSIDRGRGHKRCFLGFSS